MYLLTNEADFPQTISCFRWQLDSGNSLLCDDIDLVSALRSALKSSFQREIDKERVNCFIPSRDCVCALLQCSTWVRVNRKGFKEAKKKASLWLSGAKNLSEYGNNILVIVFIQAHSSIISSILLKPLKESIANAISARQNICSNSQNNFHHEILNVKFINDHLDERSLSWQNSISDEWQRKSYKYWRHSRRVDGLEKGPLFRAHRNLKKIISSKKWDIAKMGIIWV